MNNMKVFYNADIQKKPIKAWLPKDCDIEDQCLEQAINLSNLPFIHKHVALMPDAHSGYGMPIGGVIATKDVIIPNAVGVDIGCGMMFVETNMEVAQIKFVLNDLSLLISDAIPVGFTHHKTKQNCETANDIIKNAIYADEQYNKFKTDIEKLYYQIGTLGGGNHFIELQEDECGMLCIMIHSGSRHFGYNVAENFNKTAIEFNKQWYTGVPLEHELAFLPLNHIAGQQYLEWMGYALQFAAENRKRMMDTVLSRIAFEMEQTVYVNNTINAHHNYADLENHFGENVWVHRKGAIRAREGEIGIIPGTMGSCSYIVRGKGNANSFCSSSHGAGRLMSRKQAKANFTEIEVNDYFVKNNIVLNKTGDVADEHVFAYKDIDMVMEAQKDLTEPIKKLKPILVIKG